MHLKFQMYIIRITMGISNEIATLNTVIINRFPLHQNYVSFNYNNSYFVYIFRFCVRDC